MKVSGVWQCAAAWMELVNSDEDDRLTPRAGFEGGYPRAGADSLITYSIRYTRWTKRLRLRIGARELEHFHSFSFAVVGKPPHHRVSAQASASTRVRSPSHSRQVTRRMDRTTLDTYSILPSLMLEPCHSLTHSLHPLCKSKFHANLFHFTTFLLLLCGPYSTHP